MPTPTASPAVRGASLPDRPGGDGPGSAADVALRIARRAADPRILADAVRAHARQSPFADLLPWRPEGLAQGHAGIALLCATMDADRPGEGWDVAGHRHLDRAVAAATPHDPSLFSGLAGVGFAACRLAAGRDRYAKLLARIDAALAAPVAAMAGRVESAAGCRAGDIDLVSGLTGIGAYLLGRPPGEMRARVLATLAALLADRSVPRRWHTPAGLAAGPLRESFPGGHYNCGLAHGVPGPLALLSLALLAGVPVPGGAAAVATAGEWLARRHTGTAAEPDWPDAVPVEGTVGSRCGGEPPSPGRAAWCYGAPGVARSLWLAGAAVGEPRWQELAARTARAIAARPPELWWLSTPGVCHGHAGLLQVLRRFAEDLADPALGAAAGELAARLAATFEPDALLGVRSIEPDGIDGRAVAVDHPGLLDGAPGVALALAGSGGWDRMVLLS